MKEAPNTERKPLVIATTGRKGGVGKTTAALSLGAHYARQGLRVLLVDLDPQGSASLVLQAPEATGEHLREVLQGREAAQPFLTAHAIEVLAGGPALEDCTEPFLDAARNNGYTPRCAVVLGRVDSRRQLDAQAAHLVAGAFAVPVLIVRQDAALAVALHACQLPPAHGRAAEDYAKIAAWIL